MRFCVDYRKLHEVTRNDLYPVPRIDDTLDALKGPNYISTIHLYMCSGYYDVIVFGRTSEEALQNLKLVFARIR